MKIYDVQIGRYFSIVNKLWMSMSVTAFSCRFYQPTVQIKRTFEWLRYRTIHHIIRAALQHFHVPLVNANGAIQGFKHVGQKETQHVTRMGMILNKPKMGKDTAKVLDGHDKGQLPTFKDRKEIH